MKFRNRVRGYVELPGSRILPAPKNFRTHPEAQRDVMRGLLAEIGIAGAVLVWVPDDAARGRLAKVKAGDAAAFAAWLASYDGDFQLYDGHLRADEIRDQPIPALVTDLGPAEAAEALGTFDAVSDLAGFDREMFLSLAGDFASTNPAIQALCADLGAAEARMREEAGATGDGKLEGDGGAADRAASKEALAGQMAAADDGPEVNPTDELRKKWGTERGQLWIVPSATGEGEHRLLCGDSTRAEDVGRLMAGRRAVIMQTDAPYGVDYSASKNGIPRSGFADHTERWGDIENDSLKGDGLEAFLSAALAAAPLAENAPLYLWHPDAPVPARQFSSAMLAAGYLIHRTIIWKKPGFVLTRSGMYHWAHEPCLYGWRTGKTRSAPMRALSGPPSPASSRWGLRLWGSP